jgi:hypothetical protein
MTNFYASGPVDTKAVKVRKPRKGLTKLILGKNAVPTFSQKLKNVKEAKIKNFKSSVSSKLKNVWTQYKSGGIPTTVPWVWKKTGVKKLGNQLKAINKKT